MPEVFIALKNLYFISNCFKIVQLFASLSLKCNLIGFVPYTHTVCAVHCTFMLHTWQRWNAINCIYRLYRVVFAYMFPNTPVCTHHTIHLHTIKVHFEMKLFQHLQSRNSEWLETLKNLFWGIVLISFVCNILYSSDANSKETLTGFNPYLPLFVFVFTFLLCAHRQHETHILDLILHISFFFSFMHR